MILVNDRGRSFPRNYTLRSWFDCLSRVVSIWLSDDNLDDLKYFCLYKFVPRMCIYPAPVGPDDQWMHGD